MSPPAIQSPLITQRHLKELRKTKTCGYIAALCPLQRRKALIQLELSEDNSLKQGMEII